MKRVVTFGEIMLRLAPPHYDRFVQADTFTAIYGGGEANVAISLANYGADVAFVTKVPAHEIGQCECKQLFHVSISLLGRIWIYALSRADSRVGGSCPSRRRTVPPCTSRLGTITFSVSDGS